MTPAARMEAALSRTGKLGALIDALEYATRCDRAHARTNRSDDYLDLLQSRHAVTELLDEVLETCLDDEREQLADESLSECAYDMRQGCYIDDNGEPILPGSRHTPLGYADWLHDLRRDAELGA